MEEDVIRISDLIILTLKAEFVQDIYKMYQIVKPNIFRNKLWLSCRCAHLKRRLLP